MLQGSPFLLSQEKRKKAQKSSGRKGFSIPRIIALLTLSLLPQQNQNNLQIGKFSAILEESISGNLNNLNQEDRPGIKVGKNKDQEAVFYIPSLQSNFGGEKTARKDGEKAGTSISIDEIDFSSFETDLNEAKKLLGETKFSEGVIPAQKARDKIYHYAKNLRFDESYNKSPLKSKFEQSFVFSFNYVIFSLGSLSEYGKLSEELDKTITLNIIDNFSYDVQVNLNSRIGFALSFLNNADLSISYYDKAYNLYFEKETEIQNGEFSYNLFMRILTYKLVTIDQERTALDNIRLGASIGKREADVLDSYKKRLDQIADDFNPKIIDFDFNLSQEDNYKLFVDKYINNKYKTNPKQDANLIMFRRIWTNIFTIQYEYFNQKHLKTEVDSKKYLLSLDRIMNMLYVMEKEGFQITNGPAHTEFIRAKILLDEGKDSVGYESLKKSLALCLSKDFKDRDLALDIVSYYLRYIDQRDIKIDKEIIAVFLEKQPGEVDLDAAIEALRSITNNNISQKFGVITTMNTLYSQLEELNGELGEKNEIITQQYDQVLDLYAKLSQEYGIKQTQNRIIENQRDSLTIINQREREAREEAEKARLEAEQARLEAEETSEKNKKLSIIVGLFAVLFLYIGGNAVKRLFDQAPNREYFWNVYRPLFINRNKKIIFENQIILNLDVVGSSMFKGSSKWNDAKKEIIRIMKESKIFLLEVAQGDDFSLIHETNFKFDSKLIKDEKYLRAKMKNFLISMRALFTTNIPQYNKNCLESFDPNKNDNMPTFYLKGYSSAGKMEFNYGDKGVGYTGDPFFVASRGGGGFKARNGLSLVFINNNPLHKCMFDELIEVLHTYNTKYNIEEKTGDNDVLTVVHFYLTPELQEKNLIKPISIDKAIVLSADKSEKEVIMGGSIEKIFHDKDGNCFSANLSNELEEILESKIGKKIKLEIGGYSVYGIYEPFLKRFCFAYIPMELEKSIQLQL